MEAVSGETIPQKEILKFDNYFFVKTGCLPIVEDPVQIHQTEIDQLQEFPTTFEESLNKLFIIYESFNQPQ